MQKSSCRLEPGTAGTATAYAPKLLSATDYFPFGMQMPERVYSASEGYRYGVNGMERENAVNEDGCDFRARLYNSWNGRWLAIDPKFARYPHMSPYNIVELKMSDNTDNFVEVVAGSGRSKVVGGGGVNTDWGGGLLATHRDMKTGVFYTQDTDGYDTDASLHELGHLLGLSDRYYNIRNEKGVAVSSVPHFGYDNSLMANPIDGIVTQEMVNGVVGNAVKAYNSSLTGMWNNCSFCPGTATFDYHQQKKDHEPRTETELPQE
jgi:hypothetical protein